LICITTAEILGHNDKQLSPFMLMMMWHFEWLSIIGI
jgi:hypothetical protein